MVISNTYGYVSDISTSSWSFDDDVFITTWNINNVYQDVASKQYPKEKDKKVYRIINSVEKLYKVSPE